MTNTPVGIKYQGLKLDCSVGFPITTLLIITYNCSNIRIDFKLQYANLNRYVLPNRYLRTLIKYISTQVVSINFGFPPLNQGFHFKRSKPPTNHFVANAKSGAASAVAKQSTTSSSSSVTSSTTENRKSKKFLNKWREKASMSKFGKGTKSLVMSCISIYYQIVVVIGTEVVLKKSSW